MHQIQFTVLSKIYYIISQLNVFIANMNAIIFRILHYIQNNCGEHCKLKYK
jgi:hypothetical protein